MQYLQPLLNTPNGKHLLDTVFRRVATGRVPENIIEHVVCKQRLIPLRKARHTMDPRPIAIGDQFFNFVASDLAKGAQNKAHSLFEGRQFALGVSGGLEQKAICIHMVQATCFQGRQLYALNLDLKNCFNSFNKYKVLGALHRFGFTELIPFLRMRVLRQGQFQVQGSETPIVSDDGLDQGGGLSPLGCCVALHPFSLHLQSKVPKLMQLWYLDDATLIGDLDDIQIALQEIRNCMDLSGPDLEVKEVSRDFWRQYNHLETAGLTLSLAKTTLTPLSQAPAVMDARDQQILERLRCDKYWKHIKQTNTFKACGVFFGNRDDRLQELQDYVMTTLDKKLESLNRLHCPHAAQSLLQESLQLTGNHWARCVSPRDFRPLALTMDARILETFQGRIHFDMTREDLLQFYSSKAHGGVGFVNYTELSPLAYYSSLAQNLHPLLKARDQGLFPSWFRECWAENEFWIQAQHVHQHCEDLRLVANKIYPGLKEQIRDVTIKTTPGTETILLSAAIPSLGDLSFTSVTKAQSTLTSMLSLKRLQQRLNTTCPQRRARILHQMGPAANATAVTYRRTHRYPDHEYADIIAMAFGYSIQASQDTLAQRDFCAHCVTKIPGQSPPVATFHTAEELEEHLRKCPKYSQSHVHDALKHHLADVIGKHIVGTNNVTVEPRCQGDDPAKKRRGDIRVRNIPGHATNIIIDIKTCQVQAPSNVHLASSGHNAKAAQIQKNTRANYAKDNLIGANEELVTFVVANEGAIGPAAKKFVGRLAKAQRLIDNHDNYHCQVPEQAVDLLAGDIFTSIGYVRACAALHQMQQWLQHYQTLNTPTQAGHRSHASPKFGVRTARQRGNNFATQQRVALQQKLSRRR